jgi:hypothetical protein
MATRDEHIIRCSECGRGLIVRDTVNNGVAFLSHLKLDHGIKYIVQQMTEAKTTNKSIEKQIYKLNH